MVQVLIIMMVEIDISGGVGVGVGVVSARAVPRFGRTRKMTIKEKRRHRKLGHVFYCAIVSASISLFLALRERESAQDEAGIGSGEI